MTKITCTLTVIVTPETLLEWQHKVSGQAGSIPSAVEDTREAIGEWRDSIVKWLDALKRDGLLLTEYTLDIREEG